MSTVTIAQALQIAVSHHESGRLADAEAIYRKILAVEPSNAEALHLLGLIAHAVGKSEAAAELISQALTLQPSWPLAHGNLGEVLRTLGRLEEAIVHYRHSLELDPDFSGAHVNLGGAMAAQGQWEEAARCFEHAIALEPQNPMPIDNLGNVRMSQNRPQDAIACFERVIACDPNHADAHARLGHALAHVGRYEEAIARCRQALSLQPDSTQACINLGCVLHRTGQFEEALQNFNRAIQILSPQGTPDIGPHDIGDPQLALAHWNRAHLLLLQGDFENGWKEYEWRWAAKAAERLKLNLLKPQWKGENVQGKRLLLHAEQGWGDTLQMARYIPLAAARGATILLNGPIELRSLLSGLPSVSQWVTDGEPLPEFDFHCPLMSLPLAFNTQAETIPVSTAIISPVPALVSKWKQRLADDDRPRVGIAWAGRPTHVSDRQRSITLSTLEALFSLPGVRFISLQKGEAATLTSDFENLCDWPGELHDFGDTAALIENLDLIISVDTAVVHLAGNLGKPVWTLIPKAPDWRWQLHREDSPWYPTMRLFRQDVVDDWTSTIGRLSNALGEWLARTRAERSASSPKPA